MISTGFTWGDKSLESKTSTANRFSYNRKRKSHEEESKIHKPASNKRSSSAVAAAAAATTNTSSSSNQSSSPIASKHKKVKTPKILGEALPLDRVIEVLDVNQLQSLLRNVIQLHPEISETVLKLAPKPNLSDSLKLIKFKFDSILSHLPYKCDMESDYSYLRIKPHLNEFFHCLSDFILNYLPPVEVNLTTSLKFLDNITNLIHALPNFNNNEFQYTKMMAYDQVVNCWMIILGSGRDHHLADQQEEIKPSSSTSSDDMISIIRDLEIDSKIDHHNEMSGGKFKIVQSYIKLAIENYELVNQHMGGSLNDLISLDYSNYSITTRSSH